MEVIEGTCNISVIGDYLCFNVEGFEGVEILVKQLDEGHNQLTHDALYSLMDNLTLIHREAVQMAKDAE